MLITRTNPTPTETKLIIKAETEDLVKAKKIALKKLAPEVRVTGFRNGKVPPELVEKNLNPNILQSEVIEETINKAYAAAVRQESLRPVANPEVAIKKLVPYTELEFEVVVPTIGKIILADYTKIKASKQELAVVAADIDKVISSLQQRAATYNAVERAAKNGDQVTIDFKGTDTAGKPVAGADGTDYPLVLGSNAFIPGFETNLVGLKKLDTKKFDVTFPKDYGASALQNKKVTFEVTIKQVSEVIEPKVDDNFAASVGPFKNVADLKTDIKKQLTMEREREAINQLQDDILKQIAQKSTIEIPKLLIDEQIDRIEEEEKQNLIYRGQTWEEHLKEEKVTAEQHREQKRQAAEERVKVGIILSEIAEAEKIENTPEEIEVRLQIMRAQYQDPSAQAELAKPEALRDINSRMLTEKTLDKLLNYATKK
jgi:trigger factor